MDTRKQELKRLKKERKRAKRKYVTLWKSFGIVFLVLTLIFTPLCVIVKMLDNPVAAYFGGTFWQLKNRDKDAIYFKSDFASGEEMAAYGRELCRQVEAEGAVLLMNENSALPLKEGGKVSCFGGNGDLKTALETAGFSVNEALEAVSAYGDAAIVVLNQAENQLLQSLCDLKKAGNLQKIVILLNTDTSMQLDFLQGNPYAVDGVLWIGEVGVTGMQAVAEILTGKVNPSGALPNTLCYHSTAPVIQKLALGDNDGEYAVCQAGIYVGYRYYETRYEDVVMGTGNAGSYAYKDEVAYPFGFGLSYTTFTYSDMAVEYSEKTDRFAVTVTVTNTGSVAGKKTVQVYAQSPYTDYDKENGVEKASVSLVGFGKTQEIQPGASETVTVFVDKRDLASYDAYGAKTYILDAGKYFLTVAADAHSGVNNILAAKGFSVEGGDTALTYSWEQTELDAKTYGVSQNGAPITNQLSATDPNRYEGVKAEVKWVSRQDWQGTLPKETVKVQLPAQLQDTQYNPADYASVQMPTMGAENGLKLYDMIGLPFQDAKWQTLLDQLTFQEMVDLIGDAFRWRMPAESAQAPGARDGNDTEGMTDFPGESVMAATFNTELVYEVGKVIGNNCLAENIVCFYGPNSLGYAEDGFLAGKICAAEAVGVQEKGVNVALRYAVQADILKPQSTQSVWLREQAARELYLRPFQYAVEQNSSTGIMTAGSCLGATWIGGHKGLLTNILRNEWGGNGMVMVGDALTVGLNAVDGVLAGATAFGGAIPEAVWELSKYENDPVIVSAMRQACHRNLYALANSSGMNGIGANTTIHTRLPGLVLIFWIGTAVFAAAYVLFVILWHRGKKKWKKSEGYLDYRTMKNTLKEEKKR